MERDIVKEEDSRIECNLCGTILEVDNIGEGFEYCKECEENAKLSEDILNDILNTVELSKESKNNFNPDDILKQIEDEITLQQELDKIDLTVNNFVTKGELGVKEEDKFIEEEIKEEVDKSMEEEIKEEVDKSIEEEIKEEVDKSVEEEIKEEVDKSMEEEIKEEVDKSIEEEIKEEVDKSMEEEIKEKENYEDVTVETVKQRLFGAKNIVLDKVNSVDTDSMKESIMQTKDSTKQSLKQATDVTKEQASKLSKEAKVIATSVTATAISAKNSLKSKVNNNDMDNILDKIKKENEDGEYDHLIGAFTSTYGQDRKVNISDDSEEQYALPLKINAILYFVASLIPGVAQLYLGLTKRGTTILLIGSAFLFITSTQNLFIITAILSFADAYKLRNIYHRGGKIEDSNEDIFSLIKNGYVIVLVVMAIIFG